MDENTMPAEEKKEEMPMGEGEMPAAEGDMAEKKEEGAMPEGGDAM